MVGASTGFQDPQYLHRLRNPVFVFVSCDKNPGKYGSVVRGVGIIGSSIQGVRLDCGPCKFFCLRESAFSHAYVGKGVQGLGRFIAVTVERASEA